jgi:hypothetical protein
MSKTGQPAAAEAAREALKQVTVAYTNTHLKVLDSKGIDITQDYLATNRPIDQPTCDDNEMQDSEDPQEDLLGVARSATEMSLGEKPLPAAGEKSSKVRPAILLTEDRMTRLRATGEKIAALAPSVLKKYLENGVGRMRSLSRGSQGKPQDLKTDSGGAPKTSTEAGSGDLMETGQ